MLFYIFWIVGNSPPLALYQYSTYANFFLQVGAVMALMMTAPSLENADY